MKLHADSHLDHDLTARQLAHILVRFAERDAFFVETITLPADIGDLPCALIGPAAGTPSPNPRNVESRHRGERAWPSRTIVVPAMPRTRLLTVVAGPHDGQPCVLFTCYGGPAAPQEPGDLQAQLEARRRELDGQIHDRTSIAAIDAAIRTLQGKLDASHDFWAEHALAIVE